MLSLLTRLSPASASDLVTSRLYDESTFYSAFEKDLMDCLHEVIIESPFATGRRLRTLLPIFEKLRARNVRITVNTRNPEENDDYMRDEASFVISKLKSLGVNVLYTTRHHRKLAILDRSILYEGSLNILSQNSSCEVMRRIQSVRLAWQMAKFVKVDKR